MVVKGETSVSLAEQVLQDYLGLGKCRLLWSHLGCRFQEHLGLAHCRQCLSHPQLTGDLLGQM